MVLGTGGQEVGVGRSEVASWSVTMEKACQVWVGGGVVKIVEGFECEE